MKSPVPSRMTCIIPAAGRGSRLGLEIPKIFAPLDGSFTIWDALYERISTIAGKIILVLSPEGEDYVRINRADLLASQDDLKIVVQEKPLGMGDAIFGASSSWSEGEHLLIVWGDQFNLSARTLQGCCELHATHATHGVTLPVVRMSEPYVEYKFDEQSRLTAIRQSREGDVCQPGGWSDLGMFLLSGKDALVNAWKSYLESHQVGSCTGEMNFLPFLVYLSTQANWPVLRYEGADPAEALGINTPAELEQARKMFRGAREHGKVRT